MHIFARMTKVDEATRTVTGVIANEALDRSGEVFDYASSKPHFEKWSGDIAKATDGKSVGNVRAMHGNVAAGVLKALNMDDVEKSVSVDAHIVDDNEWKKVQTGTYTGFSIGGSYARKWKGDDGLQRYEAKPCEVSLVDLPCNPDAQFSVIKADGTQEMRKFETTTDNAEALTKWAENLTDDERAVVLEKISKRPDVNPKSGADQYGDVEFADPKNHKYPIDSEKHIRAAWSYIHMPKNSGKYSAEDAASIKAKIISAWKEKIDKDGPPDAEKVYAAQADRLMKHADAADTANCIKSVLGDETMAKGLYTVAVFAQLLDQLACISDGTFGEEEAEADPSGVPVQLRAALKPLADAFLAMAAEEVAEAIKGDDTEVMELAASGDLAKAGKRHSAKDQAAIDAMAKHHALAKKHVDAMGDQLASLQGGAQPDDTAEKMAKAADDLQKMVAERDQLAKALETVTAAHAELLTKAAPSKIAARAVTKDADAGNAAPVRDESPVLRKDGSIDHAETAMKLMKLAYIR